MTAHDELPLAPRTATRICSLCESACGLELSIDDERVTSVVGSARDLLSDGYLCPKGANMGALDADPDRLRQPLVRRGGTLAPATWDEAFEAVERGLLAVRHRHGTDAVGLYCGNPTAYSFATPAALPHLRAALGTKNNFTAGSADVWPAVIACQGVFGTQVRPVADLDRTMYFLILGANPVESNGSLFTAPNFVARMRALRARGGLITVVDPRWTRTAKLADRHVAIQPATDAYFLLGMIHTLFDERLTQVDANLHRLRGLEELAQVARDFAPEFVASACGIPSDTIRAITREFAAAESAIVYGRIGTCTVEYGTVTNWLIQALNILTGNVDRPGGVMFPENPTKTAHASEPFFEWGRYRSRVRGLAEVRGELPMAAMAEEMEVPGPGQMKALITLAGNPLRSAPDSRRLAASMSQLDFLVCIDPYLNETTSLADVVLPPPRPLQSGHFPWVMSNTMVRAVVRYAPPVFDLAEGQLSEEDILHRLTLILMGKGTKADLGPFREEILLSSLRAATQDNGSSVAGRDPEELLKALVGRFFLERFLEIAIRLGRFGDGFGRDPEGITLDDLLEHPEGIDRGPMRPRLEEIIAHPDGRMNLCPEHFLSQVEQLLHGLEAPRPEFVLVGRRDLRSNNSWMHNLPNLASGPEVCTLHMSESDADRLGIADGESARVTSTVGEVVAPVEVVARLRPGVVSLPHGWGHRAVGTQLNVASRRPGVNANELTDARVLDALSGNAVLSGIAVTIEPA